MMWRRDHEGALLLIQAGADVDAVGDLGQIPLHVAVMQQDPEMVSLLPAQGACDVVSEFGATARQAAQRKGGPVWEAFAKARHSRR